MFSNIFLFENRTVYEIMWKNIVGPERSQMTIWRKHIACWISKATNSHSEYAILIAFLQQQCYREFVSVVIRTLPVMLLCKGI
jgi:hypothetical protein